MAKPGNVLNEQIKRHQQTSGWCVSVLRAGMSENTPPRTQTCVSALRANNNHGGNEHMFE